MHAHYARLELLKKKQRRAHMQRLRAKENKSEQELQERQHKIDSVLARPQADSDSEMEEPALMLASCLPERDT